VVNPDEYIEKFGADTLRLYLMFMGPMDGYPDFRDTGIEGMRRFVERVWNLFQAFESSKSGTQGSKQISSSKSQVSNGGASADCRLLTAKMHQTIKKVTEDIEEFSVEIDKEHKIVRIRIILKVEGGASLSFTRLIKPIRGTVFHFEQG